MKNEKKIVPINYSIYDKSNFLISAKYKSTLLENKILAISLAYAQHFKTNESDIPYSEIKVSELKELLGVSNSGSFYQQLRAAAEAMTAKKIGMSSEDSQTFDYLAIVIRAKCEAGIFTIEYNPHMKQYLTEIRRNYSRLNLNTMLAFKNNYAFRLYEVLKSKAYYPKGYVPQGDEREFRISLSVAELRLELGVVNAELDTVQRILKKQKKPDFERAVEVCPEKIFETWYDFKRYVLDPAVNGINKTEGSDLRVSYSTVKSGKGGRVVGIDFDVRVIAPEKSGELTSEEKDDFIERMLESYPLNIKLREMRQICEDAGYDEQRIEKAMKCLKTANSVNNTVGFIRTALKENYEPAVAKVDEYRDYPQNKYDFEALERKLLEKHA